MTLEEAAGVLGCKARELKSVKDVRDGTLVVDQSAKRILINDEGVFWYDYLPGEKPNAGGPPNPGFPVWVPGEGAPDEPEPKAAAKTTAAPKK